MSAPSILGIYLLFFLLELGWGVALTLLNMRHVRRSSGAVPAAFAGAVDPDTYARSVSYTLARSRFGLASEAVSSAVLLAVVLSGFLGLLDGAARAIPMPPHLQGVAFILAVSVFFWLTGLPFSLWGTFSLEAKFGFNKTTPRLFVVDTLKGAAITLAISVPLLLGLFWFMDAAGRLWWAWAFCAAAAVELVLGLLAPLVIAPLFNKFTPLPEGELRDRITELAGRLGFRMKGIFVVDSSRRSRHSNAYFTGLGPVKRVVLYDTLVQTHTVEEILSVLAHEIGHEKRHHLTKGLAISAALSLAGFWILSLLLPWEQLYHAFGFTRPGYHSLLVLLAFCSGPFTFFLQPLFSMRSRRQEYEADRFAVRAMGSAAGMRAALLRLSRDNLSNLTPHPLYSFFHYSHPTLAERIAAMERCEATLGRG
jgi:STE24 endopeptidase